MRVYTTIEQVQQLPCFHREVIPETYIDIMGHVNIRHYLALFDEGGWKFFASIGMDENYYRENHAGGFALRHFITYVNEVRVGETVAVHIRFLAHSEKRIHFMGFLVNETTQAVAATLEALGTHADMKIRRTSPYPQQLREKFDAIIAEHQKLDWEAPVCGILKP